ncbi:MAG: glutamate--ammonia ligase [Proteobacteria bacterium]|nr:MAG: glutamate--ammonia ligase [Pseudomonadota bacterium]
MDTLESIDSAHSALAEPLAEQGVKYVMASWVDIMGRPRGKSTPIKLMPNLLAGFARYTPRGICGIGEMDPVEEEVTARPDPDTLTVIPWDTRFAWMAADMWSDKGEPFELCPRSILKRQLSLAADEGYSCTLGIEPEFYLFRPESLDPATGRLVPPSRAADVKPSPAYDVETKLDAVDFLDKAMDYMSRIGIEAFAFGAEGGEGQYEIDFYYKSMLEMCDRMVLLRLLLRQAAKECGYLVSFMPKPYSNLWGSGAHFNLGLYHGNDESHSVFRRGSDEWTDEARSFTAGILKHAHALTAIANPIVNSYKRLVPRLVDGSVSWAPIKISYGYNNRSCMIRFPKNRPAIENRSADPASNPYLVSAFMLAAGLEGMREGLDPGEAADFLTYGVEDVPELPSTLNAAIDAFERDELTYKVFSEGFVRDYVETKRAEAENAHRNVMQYERDENLLLT